MAEISTADLYDERGKALQSLSLQLQDIGGMTGFSGPVRTIRCFQDNALVRRALESPGNGAVLVVDGAGSLATALVGDQIASLAADNGWAGLIVNGAVRDRIAIGTLPIGVKALGSNPAKSTKTGEGEVDVPVDIGGITFAPGAYVWCDEDGVLVDPAGNAGA
ncbi:regulator of ribonuclease activity A [Leucobacter exalbidus]|uniref:4-hydroxy-4-methyl-2-oxoglutarate aldolase n=1 Tax=Leucobacter exalbidus TaxID=662960 RepID=A0A940T3K9_9MICO|nr:ribonuclease E activity regulator RraA [Leucobacter exalbidus]MBP1325923.1 regulator of ribonuclease activity A [Leucobacter exalbidus]